VSLEMQERRFMRDYDGGVDLLIAPEEVESGGVTHEMARKWKLLNGLQDRNETLFYR
jgi:malate dehydrogenase (decarboxylating)